MMRFLPALFLLGLLFGPAPHAYAQTCAGGCDPNYTCQYDANHMPECVQNCSDGSVPGPNGCTVDEITVTAAPKMTFARFVTNVEKFVDTYVVGLLYAIAFVFFVWGMFIYFFTGGEENRTKGRAFVIWSVIGFVVIFSLWGIVNLFLSIIPT